MKKDIEENRKAHRKSSVTPPSRNNTIFMSVYPIPVFYVCVYVCVFVCIKQLLQLSNSGDQMECVKKYMFNEKVNE